MSRRQLAHLLASALVLLGLLAAGCERKPRHRQTQVAPPPTRVDPPARVDPPPKPKHQAHEHAHGAHPHDAHPHHHHPHPHPHLDGPDGHHHPY